MIHDYPVVEKLHLYEAAGSVEFLEALEQNNLFESEVGTSDE